MDAAVAEPSNPAVGYVGRSIEDRVSVLEGTISNQNRIFDMLHEGQQNLREEIKKDIASTNQRIEDLRSDVDWRFGEVNTRIGEMRDDMDKRFGEMRDDMDMRFGEVNERITGLATRIDTTNSKIDSNLKWMLGVQIAMWVTIIVAVLL